MFGICQNKNTSLLDLLIYLLILIEINDVLFWHIRFWYVFDKTYFDLLKNIWIPDSVTSSLMEISVFSLIKIDQILLHDGVNVIRRSSKNKSRCCIY